MYAKWNLSLSDIRLIHEYLSATRNEIAHDDFQICGAKSAIKGFPKLPRPAKWIGAVGLHAKTLTALRFLFIPIWVAFGWLYFLKEQKKWKEKVDLFRSNSNPDGGEITLLAFSERSMDVVFANFPESKHWNIFAPPWIELDHRVDPARIVNIGKLLQGNDCARIMRLAIAAHYILNSRKDFSGWGLQSYAAWRWFFVRLAVSKLSGSFVTTEHFDRWAVLADLAVSDARRRGEIKGLKLIQHGSVNAKTADASLNFKLPTRLTAVDELWVYTVNDEKIFRDEILHASLKNLSVNYFSLKFSMTENESLPGISLLVVGHPLCEKFQIKLMQKLGEGKKYNIFYKPHPSAPASKKLAGLKWLMVCGKNQYPKTDIVIGYPSTLLDEYSTAGVPVVEHSMNAGVETIFEVEEFVCQKLKAR